jgi:hypothetical protein
MEFYLTLRTIKGHLAFDKRRLGQKYLEEPDEESMMEEMRCHTNTGRPLGEDSFIEMLEKQLGRRLKALPIGRPKKE